MNELPVGAGACLKAFLDAADEPHTHTFTCSEEDYTECAVPGCELEDLHTHNVTPEWRTS